MEFFSEPVGELINTPSETAVEWKIKSLFSDGADNKKSYESPSFSFNGASWCLRVFPYGERIWKPSGNQGMISLGIIDLYLCRKTSGSPINVKFSLGLKTVNGEINPVEHFTHSFDSGARKGTYNFINRSKLLERRTELWSSGCLTVVCKMKHIASTEVLAATKFSSDFERILLTGDHSDVIAKVKGKEFKLHRSILSARNSYFDSMFKSDMRETTTGIVTIEDCEPCVFRSFIYFVYTGKVDKFSPENVCDLYQTADKYQEDQLKKECMHFMLNTLSIDNFCDFITLALMHDEKTLYHKASELFMTKGKDIARTSKWQDFLKKYPTQANELFIQALDSHMKYCIPEPIPGVCPQRNLDLFTTMDLETLSRNLVSKKTDPFQKFKPKPKFCPGKIHSQSLQPSFQRSCPLLKNGSLQKICWQRGRAIPMRFRRQSTGERREDDDTTAT